MKAYELATSLRGVAQGIVTDIEPAKRLNYDYFASALTSRFEPANQEMSVQSTNEFYLVESESNFARNGTKIKGSTICVIHPGKFEFKPEIQRNNQRLCLADGSFVNTMGHVDLPIKIGNYTIIQKFTVAEIDVPAVIGYDFLHKNNCTIDMGKGVLLLKDSKIDCIKESQMSSTFKIKLSDKLTIPPTQYRNC
ncbi:unnamed protein product [Mytilus edulis]|uniref:Uncharacterized protein n=1 Tax=Mytilus edulis TaxID=6550 RepID=A0A8S3TQ85_MYTED|nr:unnamed protein product [Mytilus edulis]